MSTVFYLLGVAAVLYLRPAVMFHADGRWKEFGVRDPNATMTPFWLFCVVWALVSFLVGQVLFPASAAEALTSVTASAAAASAALTPQSLTGRLSKSLLDEDGVTVATPLKPLRGGVKQRGGGEDISTEAAADAAEVLAALKKLKGGLYRLATGEGGVGGAGGTTRKKRSKQLYLVESDSDSDEDDDNSVV